MTNDEINRHLARVGQEFRSAAVRFATALSAAHAKVDCTRQIPAKELATIYAGRRNATSARGVSMDGLDALVMLLQSSDASVKWTVVGVSGGSYWAALFIPDDGSATACIARVPE